jgi:hypothetical protein
MLAITDAVSAQERDHGAETERWQMLHAEARTPLHDGILERTLDEAEHTRNAEHAFWARIAAERAARRHERSRTRPRRREGTIPNRQRQAGSSKAILQRSRPG